MKEKEFKVLPQVLPNPSDKKIDIETIKHICHARFPLSAPLEERCIAWLVLLNIYPQNPNLWLEEREKLKNNYIEIIHDFQLEGWENIYIPENIKKAELNVPNQELMFTVHVDVIRTTRHFKYFPKMEPPKGANLNDKLAPYNEYLRRMERILYIFGTINLSYSYIQGFNELLVPFYFVFYSAEDVFYSNMDLVEAISFNCLQQLITNTELQVFYTRNDVVENISLKMSQFDLLLKRHLPAIAEIFSQQKIDSITYAHRWFSLMFAQETMLLNILQIWDVLFSRIQNIVDFLLYLGVAHVKILMKDQENLGYSKLIMHIQSSVIHDPYELIRIAEMFYEKDQKLRKRK